MEQSQIKTVSKTVIRYRKSANSPMYEIDENGNKTMIDSGEKEGN